MGALPSWALLATFLVSAGVIWAAGIKLSNYTDGLAERLHLGQTLGGVIGVRARRPLTFMAASLTLVLEAATVVAILLVALAGTQLPDTLIFARLAPGTVRILILWVVSLKIGGAGSKLPGPTAVRPPTDRPSPADTDARAPNRRPPTAGSPPAARQPRSASPPCSPSPPAWPSNEAASSF